MISERVYFYSKYDLAASSHLKRAESLLNNFSESESYDINDIIEFYNVKLYIDYEIFPKQWTESDIQRIKKKTGELWSLVVKFWNKINSENVIQHISQLENWTIHDSFWRLIANLNVYKKIDRDTFNEILSLDSFNIRSILKEQTIVKYFFQELRSYLMKDEMTAELLLSQYAVKQDGNWTDLYFPKCLNDDDVDFILSRYLNSEKVNLNFIRLIASFNNSKLLTISLKTKLKALKIEEKLNAEILKDNTVFEFGVQVEFDESQIEPFKINRDGNVDVYSYGTKSVLKGDNPIDYIKCFLELFLFLDRQGCISLVSKDTERNVWEKIFMKGKDEYHKGLLFVRKEYLSFAQISLFDKVLTRNHKPNLEKIIHLFVDEYLENYWDMKGFRFNLPSTGTTYSEKIRYLIAEFDALLRQYKLYKEDGEIDFDLFHLSSSPLSLSQIPSFAAKKYCYAYNDKLKITFHHLFSDQSELAFLYAFRETRCKSFYELINKEKVKYSQFESFQKGALDYLLNADYLFVDQNNYVKIKNSTELFLLSQLYNEQVLNYGYYSKECRLTIDRMVNDQLLFFENTLFNKLEQSYFNYYLNKKEFSNGLDIRNSFAHGTNRNDESILVKSYYILLKLLILTILKIDGDLTMNSLQNGNDSV